MSLFQPNTSPNANGSIWLGLINIASWFLGLSLPAIFQAHGVYHTTHFALVETLVAVITVGAATVNLKNTFETNSPWKEDVGAFSVIANLIGPAVFIALTFN
jgi:hypothetical protein